MRTTRTATYAVAEFVCRRVSGHAHAVGEVLADESIAGSHDETIAFHDMLHKRNMMLKDNMSQAKELTQFIDTYIQEAEAEEAPAAAAPDAASSSTVESTA